MVEPADDYDFKHRRPAKETSTKQARQTLKQHHLVKYPWDLWTNGEKHRVQKGVDFESTVAGLKNSLYHHAKAHGFTCATGQDGANCIVFQFTKKVK